MGGGNNKGVRDNGKVGGCDKGADGRNVPVRSV